MLRIFAPVPMFAYVGVPKAASLGKYHSANNTFTAQFQTYTHVGHTMTIWWEHLTSMVADQCPRRHRRNISTRTTHASSSSAA